MEEPELIKAGSAIVKLGYKNKPVEVDCRVVPEEYYQEMKMLMHKPPIDVRLFKSVVSKLIKKYAIKVPEDEKLAMEWIAAMLHKEFNIT